MFLVRQLRPHPDVVARRMGDRAVLVHLKTNAIFELNDSGVRIWELIREHGAPDAVADALVEEFSIDRARAERDVHELVAELKSAGLLQA